MIDYATYRRIHHLNEAETLNVAQIAERLALDPRTVRYWLDEPTFRPRQTAPRPSKLDPYKPLIRQWLEALPVQRHADLPAPGGCRVHRRHQHRARVRAEGAAENGAGLPDPALRARRVRPGGLGPITDR